MQVKTRYKHKPTEWAKSKPLPPPNYNKDIEQEFSFISGRKAKWHNHFEKVWQFVKNPNIWIKPYDPAIVILGIYPNELKSFVHTKICTQMSTSAFFIIAKTWM